MSNERYEIRGKIGQGGVGAVYRAYDTQLRREVAIKRVLTEGGYEDSDVATKNLLKEATALSSVQHPHICTVYDAGIDKEGPYVVMELINGKTLDEMVERGTLTYDDFREVAIQSQEAMIAAQDLDLVHRDLKPSNVMVCWLPSGRFQVKLVDFGLAKFSAKPSLQTIDHGDAVFGSIFFMAPEQFERTPLDRRTDMYSLGSMYYYSLAGTYPFNGDSAPQVMASHLQNSVQPLHEVRPDLPRWVCDWVMWHIRRNMNDRPESARAALEKFLADEAAHSQSAQLTRTGPRLLVPASSPQSVQPAGISPNPGGINTSTAPQPISPPSGLSTLSTTQSIRPQASITGGTAVQPARPSLIPATTVSTITGPANVAPAQTSHFAAAGASQYVATTPEHAAEHAAAALPPAKAKRPPMSKNTKIIIGSVVGAGVVLFSILIVSKLSTNNENETFNKLIEQVSPTSTDLIDTTQEETEILLNSINSIEAKNRTAVYVRLKLIKAAGATYNPDKLILSYAKREELGEETRRNLFILIAKRGNEEVIGELLDYAMDHPDDPNTQYAVQAAAKKVTPSNFDSYLAILTNSTNSQVRKASEQAVEDIIKDSTDKNSIATKLADSFENVDEADRLSIIRLLGSTGAPKAKEKIIACLKSNSSSEQIAAASAFSKWPNDEPFEALIEAFDATEGPVKVEVFKNAVKLLASDHPHNSATIAEDWRTVATLAEKAEEKIMIIRELSRIKQPWVMPLLQYFTNDTHDNRTIDFAQRAIDSQK